MQLGVKMQLAQFIIPVHDDGSSQEACNRFLRSVKVVEIDRQLTCCEGVACWPILNVATGAIKNLLKIFGYLRQ